MSNDILHQQPATPYVLLADAMRHALNSDTQQAIACIKLAREVAQPDQIENVELLISAVMHDISKVIQIRRVTKGSTHNEYGTVQFWFRNNYQRLFPGAETVKYQRIAGTNPDFMLELDGERTPVECKIAFTGRSLNQLLAYLEAYEAKRGVAVAFRLDCELPDNITFIECPEEARHV